MEENHCKDCCCAASWKALGITEYTGKSIPEHIEALTAELAAAKEEIERLTQGFVGNLYMGACYCRDGHVCSPCTIKRDIALTSERKETERLREDLNAIFTIAENAPELNMINYDHDQVAALNAAMVEVWEIVHAGAAPQSRQGEE